MAELLRAYGLRLTALLWLAVALWIIGLVIAPLATLVARSLTSVDPQSIVATIEVDRLSGELAAARWDFDHATTPERRVEIDRRIRLLADRLRRADARETAPQPTWGIANYTSLSGLPGGVLLRTLGQALAVTAIALLVGYPVAWLAAVVLTGRRAALLLGALIVPWAIGDVLRLCAWATLFDPPGAGIPAMVYGYGLAMVFPIWAALTTLDRHQIEAARDLGASALRIHTRIVLPHARPGLAVGAIMTFLLCAGSYAVPQITPRGRGGDGFGQQVARRIFDTADWGVGAAYALALMAACLLVAYALMRAFRLRWRDLARRGG